MSKKSVPRFQVTLLQEKWKMRLKSTFIDERNNDILRAYREIVASNTLTTQREAILMTINSKSSRFWVTAECATKAIYRLRGGDNLMEMKKHRREMFLEILHKYENYKSRKEFANKSIVYICTFIVEEPAPKFYLAVSTAMKLFKYQVKKNRECKKIYNYTR